MAAEFEGYLSAFSEERLPNGRRRVDCYGYLPERKILKGIGGVEVAVPSALSTAGWRDFRTSTRSGRISEPGAGEAIGLL